MVDELDDIKEIDLREAESCSHYNPSCHYDYYGFLLTEEENGIQHSVLLRRPLNPHDLFQNWSKLLSIPSLFQSHSESKYYQKLVDSINPADDVIREVQLDVERTFSGNPLFGKINGKERTAVILSAYAARNREVGYCQGMNHIVGFLLLLISTERLPSSPPPPPDEYVFWMLCHIVEDPKYNFGYYLKHTNMRAFQADVAILRCFINRLMPKLFRYLCRFPKIPFYSMLASGWFINLFIGSLPTETVLRIWDEYILQGRVIMFRTALSLLHLCENELLQVSDIQLIDVVRQQAKSLFNAEELLQLIHFSPAMAEVTSERIAAMTENYHAKWVANREDGGGDPLSICCAHRKNSSSAASFCSQQ